MWHLLFLGAALGIEDPPIPLAAARAAFEEAREASDADGGHRWGVRLYGPTLFVDPATRFVVANRNDAEGLLAEREGVFTGTLPEREGIANTATRWAGVTWTMVMWPLPEDPASRTRLLIHESFHRVAPEIGIPGSNPSNAHLETPDGRTWLRLERRALAQALILRGDERRRAIEDALVFRRYRRSLFSKAAEEERLLELNEGLAEYTGHALSGLQPAILARESSLRLEREDREASFARSFAYASGPAYGVLLDEAGAEWRRGLGANADLGALLAEAIHWKPSAELSKEAQERAPRYDGEAVAAEERERAEAREAAVARHRARYIEGPVLLLPLSGDVSYTFDPRRVEPIGDLDSVYGTLRVTDRWGILEAPGGALLTRAPAGNVASVRVPAPKEAEGLFLAGEGWTLSLEKGWRVVPGARSGDFTVSNER